jgi:hypothetical protein
MNTFGFARDCTTLGTVVESWNRTNNGESQTPIEIGEGYTGKCSYSNLTSRDSSISSMSIRED